MPDRKFLSAQSGGGVGENKITRTLPQQLNKSMITRNMFLHTHKKKTSCTANNFCGIFTVTAFIVSNNVGNAMLTTLCANFLKNASSQKINHNYYYLQ